MLCDPETNLIQRDYIIDSSDICWRTQTAIRAMTMPKRQLEKFIAGTYTGEKEQKIYEQKLRSILIEFGEQTDEALNSLAKAKKCQQVDVMILRWKQIQAMLDGCASYQKEPWE
jgi:hypothetical protein